MMTMTSGEATNGSRVWRRPDWTRTSTSILAAAALLVAVVVGVSVTRQETASAAPPVVGEPSVQSEI